MIPERSDTDGLASAYQLTQLTSGGSPILETGGGLLIGVIIFPQSEPLSLTPGSPEPPARQLEVESGSEDTPLAREMAENELFLRLVERGMLDLEQGHHLSIGEVKRKMQDVL